MPAQNNLTRAQFRSLKVTLVKAIGDIVDHEIALKRKPDKTPEDHAKIAKLFQKRTDLQDGIAKVREVEIRFITSPIALEEAARHLKGAANTARKALAALKRLDTVLASATTIAGIVADLLITFA